MKINKQKLEEIKNKINNIKSKIANNKKENMPKKYYVLLILMLLVGVVTLANNMKEYNESKKEDYIEYELEKNNKLIRNVVQEEYKTDVSSISTDISNMQEGVIATISNRYQTSEYLMPVSGEVVKEYAVEKLVYSNTLGMWKTHPGIDIKAEIETEVIASSSGIVQDIKKDSFYGNVVEILDSRGYIFVYANLDDNIKLKQGDKVNIGDVVGMVGVSASGELADEAHLHFEVIKDGQQINPLDLIN